MNGNIFYSQFLFPVTTVAVTNSKYNETLHDIEKYAIFCLTWTDLLYVYALGAEIQNVQTKLSKRLEAEGNYYILHL